VYKEQSFDKLGDKMGSLACYMIWLIIGALLAWLVYYYLSKRCCKKIKDTTQQPEKTANAAASLSVVATEIAKENTAPKKVTPKTTTTKPKTTTKKTAIDLAAAKAAGINIKNADDLTVIVGLGPKISALFKDNGLNSFTQIADASVPQMRAILDKGGARYRLANPSTWAKQAKLAANNKWSALKKLQDELSGGKLK
jgi:predicted flap endonuclease-1-like 5' DNA nuclease